MITIKNKLQPFAVLTFILFVVWTLSSCKKDDAAEGTDKELYDMSKTTSGFVWYKFSDALLDKSAGSGHSQPFLRTRFNQVAAGQLDSIGKILADAAFPEGSLVVKELYENASTLDRYAILFKDSGSEDADANGWVWGYLNADGTVVESASKKGVSCIGCHSQSDNIDYMLMNKFFP